MIEKSTGPGDPADGRPAPPGESGPGGNGPDGDAGWVLWGRSYVVSVKGAKEQSFRIFNELLQHQVKGLCISNEPPKKIFERYDTFVLKVLNNDPIMIMLNEDKIPHVECVHPIDLDGLIIQIRDFVREHPNSVVLLDGLGALLMNNSRDAYKVGQFILYARKLMEEEESILLVPVHPNVLTQALFTELLPLLQGAPNLHFVMEEDLKLDMEKINLVANTLCESKLDIQPDNITRMWHDLRGVVERGILSSKRFSILSDKKPFKDLDVKVVDGLTGKPLDFETRDFEETIELTIHFPEPLKKGEEYNTLIEYRTTAFQALGEDFYLHSVVRPIKEIRTRIRFPEGVKVTNVGKSDYQFPGDEKRPLDHFPSAKHRFQVSDDERDIIHELTDSPDRCMFRIIWNTVER